MTNLPAPVNKAATNANYIIKVVNQIVTDAAEKALETYVPALGLPVIKQITEAIENAVANQVTKLEQTGVTFLIIDFQVSSEKGDVADQIAAIKAARDSGNALLLQTAIKHFADAHSALIHSDGSAAPTGL